jgi:hypothetical protein
LGKRYVFWRDPAGRPHRGTDGKHALSEILAEIGNEADASDVIRIKWSGSDFHLFETALKPALVVLGPDDEEVNDSDAWSFIWKAITSLVKAKGGKRPIAPAEFLKEADHHAAEYFRRHLEKYFLVSSLSVSSLPARTVKVNNSVVNELQSRGKRFPLPPVVEAQERYSPLLAHVKKSKSKLVYVQTHGRSIHDATDRALSDLTLLRGLWTLFSTYGSWTISFGSTSRKSLGVIHAGPLHTLHRADGEPVDDVYWYEHDFVDGDKLFAPSRGWEPVEKHRKWAASRLKALPYRKDLENLLIRYATALDQVNLDVAFLHLWSILEKLTDTVGGNYDETVKRAVWAYTDRKLAIEMLEAMRLHRNRLVHAARSGNDRDQVVYMIKMFLEPHLLRLLRNDFEVASLKEYGKCLALPTSVEELERQHRKVGKALRMMRGRASKSQREDAGAAQPAPKPPTAVPET